MLNVAVVMGRLVADPELRMTANNTAVTNFTLAVERSYAKSGAERETDFIDIVAWRNTAEFACKYFTKGQMMAVHGSIQIRSYTDKDGNKRKAFEIVADEVNFGGDKRRDEGTSPPMYSESQKGYFASVVPAAPAYISGGQQDFEEVIGNDDLPF